MNPIISRIALEKLASSATLKPHQTRVLKRLEKQDGIVVHHSTGSGKTLTFLTAVADAQKREPNKKALILAPASLITNIDKELNKHNIKVNRNNLIAMSYSKAARGGAEELRKHDFSIAVADEGHKLRNTGTKTHQELKDIISRSGKRLITTATPTYNKASDIAPLVNMAAGYRALPQGSDFDKAFINKTKTKAPFFKRLLGAPDKVDITLRDTHALRAPLQKYVDHHDVKTNPESAKAFPTSSSKTVDVPMGKQQKKLYSYLEGKLPWLTRWKIRRNLPLSKKERKSLNAFSSGIRQVSNSSHPFTEKVTDDDRSPKMTHAVKSLAAAHKADKNFRGLVYSNFLDSGVNEYSRKLKEQGIDHGVYTGKLTAKEKDALVKQYNTGKKRVLLVSSSGTEGLDLKGTKKIQVLDPHFNESKIKQVTGRGIRYKSHAHLSPKERHVEVEHYHTVLPKTMFGLNRPTSIDKYMHQNADKKSTINSQLVSLINQRRDRNKANGQKINTPRLN